MLDLWLGLALGGEVARPDVVVTFDNGEFNAPLYAARWNGRWRQPSMAQELASHVARVTGNNPRVFSYMPAGRVEGLPGRLHEVLPRRGGCTGEALTSTDPCWCPATDNCWGGLQANYHPSGSTSLVRTVSAVREAVRQPGRPRIEVHFTDYFEEDPTAAEDPADSDRCVTADGVRRAVAGVLALGEGETLDHLSLGLLRVQVQPPPPGGGWGSTYRFEPVEGGGPCWSGKVGRSWDHRAAPLDMVMGVLVVGVGTAEDPPGARAFLEGLLGQLNGEGSRLDLVTAWAPVEERVVEAVVSAADADPFRLPPVGPAGLPCGDVAATAELTSPQGRLAVVDVQGRCNGETGVTFAAGELGRHFVRHAGLDPSVHDLEIAGEIRLRSDPSALARDLSRLDPTGERGLPLWSAVVAAVDPVANPEGPVRPWATRVEVRSLRVQDLDRRPWLVAMLSATMAGLAVGISVMAGLRQLHAARAMREHYQTAGVDPDRQRPLAVILAEAQRDVAARWPLRTALAVAATLLTFVVAFWAMMGAYRVLNG